jgi:energy-coupling factor transporter ATP-binding protein EcfA2
MHKPAHTHSSLTSQQTSLSDSSCVACTQLGLRAYADRTAGSYSGGNRRKLSVGIALVGDPACVLLDEPSTGMDPQARRSLWDIIASTAASRAVVLTSHSMEECDALCTRLTIMVAGRACCMGSVQHLKARFGGGYSLEFRMAGGTHRAALCEFVATQLPTAQLVEHSEVRAVELDRCVHPAVVTRCTCAHMDTRCVFTRSLVLQQGPSINSHMFRLRIGGRRCTAWLVGTRLSKALALVRPGVSNFAFCASVVDPLFACVCVCKQVYLKFALPAGAGTPLSTMFEQVGGCILSPLTPASSLAGPRTEQRIRAVGASLVRLRTCVPRFAGMSYYLEQHSRLTAMRVDTLHQVEAARRKFPIDDYGVSQTSLEQVFVRFAQQQPAALPPSLAYAAPRQAASCRQLCPESE